MDKNYTNDETSKEDLSFFESKYKNMSKAQMAEEAVNIATRQITACHDFKKPRISRLNKYWELYDGKTQKKIRQLFNVPIPVFAGMIDTLNAEYDTPIQVEFKETDASDYYKALKINGAFKIEVMSTAQNSKWDSKLRLLRKHAIINGVAIPKYTAESDPEYKSILDIVNLKNFNFQPRGGMYIENHLFAGEEDIEKTKSELIKGANRGDYDKAQVKKLITICESSDYLPDSSQDMADKLSRFKPLGLNPESNNYVGESVYKLAQHIMEIDGERYYLFFHPWSKTWLRFEKWSDICSSNLYPWSPYATHEDDENFLSKSYGDDLYSSADAIVAMFNQELTNREKQNFGARAFDKDMFTDVRKLDEAMHRPDGLVPVDTKNGTRRIAEGIYKFEVGGLSGTVNLIDWITNTIGRSTGATDLSMGSVQSASKKASVTFAEQKSVSKRIGWSSSSFQEMMANIGKKYLYGLKDHMPAKMAIKVLGQNGLEWEQITRMDLNTTKDLDIVISSADRQVLDNEAKSQKRKDAIMAIGVDPNLATIVNPQWRAEQLLRTAEYDDVEVAVAMDIKNFADKKALAHSAEAIQLILLGRKPEMWYGANVAFMQKIVDFASDNRATLKEKYNILLDFATAHKDIAMENMARKAQELNQQINNGSVPPPSATAPAPVESTASNPGMTGGMSRAMDIGNSI